MAITYAISKCRGNKIGVYVKALSGNALIELRDKFPELPFGPLVKGAIQVKSDRLGRFDTVKQAKQYVDKLAVKPDILARLRKLYMSVTDKDFVLDKFQYFKLDGDVKGDTTQDKVRAHETLVKFSDFGVNVRLKRTVARSIKMVKPTNKGDNQTYNEELKRYNEERGRGEITPNIPNGMKGILLPINKQRHKDSRNIPVDKLSGPKRKTQSLNFWKNR